MILLLKILIATAIIYNVYIDYSQRDYYADPFPPGYYGEDIEITETPLSETEEYKHWLETGEIMVDTTDYFVGWE